MSSVSTKSPSTIPASMPGLTGEQLHSGKMSQRMRRVTEGDSQGLAVSRERVRRKKGDMGRSLRGMGKDWGCHGLPLWAWTGLNPKEEKLGKLREMETGESEGWG